MLRAAARSDHPRLSSSPLRLAGGLLLAAAVALPTAAAPEPPGPGAAAAEPALPPSPFAADAELERIGRLLGLRPGGVQGKAEAITRYIFDGAGGLGFQYSSHPTRTAQQAWTARSGNCLSLVNLFIALARHAGLEAFPLEVEDFESFSRQDGVVVRRTHVIGGMAVNGDVWTIDFLPDRPKTYRRMQRISDERHAALHYTAVAVEAMFAGDVAAAERLFREALAWDAGAAEAWNNFAVLARRQGDEATARERLERALEHDPRSLPALNNLSALHRRAGRLAEARGLEERALALAAQSPYFLTGQALRRIGAGDLEGAERLLDRARRIDSRVPEVYLALARIDLLRGREQRAERHFAHARRRSQDLSAGFQQGVEAKITKLEKLAAGR
ncbi:MAG TPA: tetratricopeptide repeat protein [Thermoanaerobaculia bacterium]|nr:tetratricopeptide repeat protein [Thermoanaerobaculia bacterium]